MRTRIAIDPNVRVRGNQTFAALATARPVVGTSVEVWEPESGVVGDGVVSEIDDERGLVYVAVNWSSLREPQPQVIVAAVPATITEGRN